MANPIHIEEQFDTLQLLSPVIDIEESRTSGVGENSNNESEVKSGQDNADDTLPLEALSASKTGQESTLSVIAIDLAALGRSAIEKKQHSKILVP